MWSVSGSKSQPGSGVPAAALANKSFKVVANPSAASATFLQKSGPRAALKVTGSHSSRATTWARAGGFDCAGAKVAPANTKQLASNAYFTTVFIVRASIRSISQRQLKAVNAQKTSRRAS